MKTYTYMHTYKHIIRTYIHMYIYINVIKYKYINNTDRLSDIDTYTYATQA